MAVPDVTRLARQLTAVDERVRTLEAQRGREGNRKRTPSRYPSAAVPDGLRDLEQWAVAWLQHTLERRASNTRRWCAQWYNHSEVVTRFRVLRLAHTQTERYGDALDMSTWFLDHLDKHLEVVFSTDGPFAGCSPQRHSPHRGLLVSPVPSDAQLPQLEFVERWVVNWLQHTLERRASNTRRWCAQWYRHPEVVTRFGLLQRAYDEADERGDAVEMSTWFVDHLDKHLEVVFSTDGPFAGCSPQRHSPHQGLKITRAPAGHRWGRAEAGQDHEPDIQAVP